MNPQIKIPPVRSPKYRAFIREHRCVFCNSLDMRGMEASHQNIGYGKTGGKVSDLQTVPAHHNCHKHPPTLDDDQISRPIIAFINEFFGIGNRLEKRKP